MHVPTGIFLTAGYSQSKDKNLSQLIGQQRFTDGTLGPTNYTGAVNDKNKSLTLMAGIEQKWFSIGKSTVYGEYQKADIGTGIVGGAAGTGQLRTIAATDPLTGAAGFLAGSQTKTWGIGFNQAIDAAAADWYVSFRNTSGSINTVTATGAALANTGIKDIQVLTTGMIIRF
jgi:hypothetical protein